ncbi:MAG: hypothetical protein WCT77_10715 [Bacteroidota bacterium]|jgi:hypothetical protein
MLTSIRKICLIALALTLCTAFIYAQPAEKAKERIGMMKKMKLLEILNLDEQQSEKFIAQYSSWERKIEEQRANIDKASGDLRKSVKDNASNDELEKKSGALIDAQSKLQNIYFDKLKAMKSLLNTKEYAKYLVFEDRFLKELQKILIKRSMSKGKGNQGPRFDDDE